MPTTPAQPASANVIPSASQIPGYYFLTPVWGASYTRLFVDVAIPAQLAAGNLQAFHGVPGCRYVIYTTPKDADVITSSPVFKALNECIPVSFEWLDAAGGNNHDKMSACYRAGIAAANQADAGILFLTPDIVFADGSFATIKRLATSGYDAVFVPAIRTLKPGVVAALRAHQTADNVISVRPRDLMQIALDNLHPLADASWWNLGEADLLPANLYWPVGKEGILGRCFHLHPIFVHPQKKNVRFFGTVDDDFFTVACPDSSKDYVVSDSDEFLSIELSDLAHFFRTGFRKGSVDDAALWAEQFASDRHRMLFDHVVRMHTGMRDLPAWEKADNEAAQVAGAIKAKLSMSWLALVSKGNQGWIRRIIRKNMDRRLAAENRYDNPAMARLAQLASAPSSWLINFYLFVIRNIPKWRRWYFGTIDHPRFFTAEHMVRGLLKNDVLQLAGSASDIVLVSDDPANSVVFSILSEAGRKAVFAAGFRNERELGLMSRDLGKQLAPSSCDLVIVEQGRRDAQDIFVAAHGVLRPNGRLLALSGWWEPSDTTKGAVPLDRTQAELMLSPRFRIAEHRQQGTVGAVEFYRFNGRLVEWTRRSPVTTRIAEFALPFIWVPLFIIVNSVARGWGITRDRFDRNPAVWLTSLTLAEKV